MHLVLLLAAVTAPPAEATSVEAADTAVVCPEHFVAALRPWLIHRASQGHRFALISNTGSSTDIRNEILKAAEGGQLKYVVLVGDDEPAAYLDPYLRRRCVPSFRARAKVSVRFGGEPLIATDNPYGDLDGDGAPELAVGRLPADSAGQLQTIVDKILRYERESSFDSWRRKVNFIAGVGGFGMMADAIIEMSAKRLITEGVPEGFDTSMTYASWRSPYCPDPRRFHDTAVGRLNEGSLFWVYIGHGQRTALDWVRVPGRAFHILDTRDVPYLDCRHGLPIAIMLSCHTAAFDKPEDCLAEEMLRHPGAPVAVIGGTRVTMPYAMTVLATAMLDEYFTNQRDTLGEVLLESKKRLLNDKPDDPQRRLIDSIAAAVSPAPKDLAGERAEHVLLFHLIGDPLLKLHHPQPMEVKVASYASPGDQIDVEITTPIGGSCHVELVCRRDRTTFKPPSRPQYDSSDVILAGYDEVYQRANDHRYSERVLVVSKPGTFRTQLDVPKNALGPCHVRAYVWDKQGHALGAADVYLRRKRPAKENSKTVSG
jgi:hypothetical protein